MPTSATLRRYLIVCTLRIGDVLLATPLARSIKASQPNAQVDMLVLKGMEGVLEGNPDIAQVLAVPHRTSLLSRLRELRQIWRKYDVALSTVSSDRARLYSFVAGRISAAPYNPHSSRLSVGLLSRKVLFDDLHTHTVIMGLRVLDLVGIPRSYSIVPPTAGGRIPEFLEKWPYAVLHPYPKFTYKMWGQEGWKRLAQMLCRNGLKVVLTGGPESGEKEYNQEIASAVDALDLTGKLTLAETADIISRARVFIGPDTGVTHMAAATGAPTIAIFGPSNPVKWGPWPAHHASDHSPWSMKGSGRVGNVTLIQGEGDCVPCRAEGCERRRDSYSRCLDTLSPARVIEAVAQAL
jgi:heptosyltransferase-3